MNGIRMSDGLRYARAMMTNQVARYAPSLYVRLTRQTGRGAREIETAAQIADYFSRCVADYFAVLGMDPERGAHFLSGKTVLEYGPGDLPGVAMLLVAHGARKVYCIDRFPMFAPTRKNFDVVEQLASSLAPAARARLMSCFVAGDPAAGFANERIDYLVRPRGLSGLRDEVDLVMSRAVLEHVDDLPALFGDMLDALHDGALAVHQVDLRSHGLHRHNPLDFLAFSPPMWDLLYSHKGVPNRYRIDAYRSILASLPVSIEKLEPTSCASAQDVADVRPHLAGPFRTLSDDDLSWLGFWLVFRKNMQARIREAS
jgi:hypothetical protein